ncbi:PoNe immunity protein domain-containing protein [Agarivorans aestuarii]|uniref:PoNe immunity protein domain-containing protein n=1 Tax=Agarivorans aestuarii TaxID=1563703 RepID=UPI001C80EF32|nr:PoNe immunity protein domain-containing protein [Agarivorans aestuarii]
MLRDTLKDKTYFDERIDFKINAIEKRKAKLLASPQVRAFVSLKVHFTMVDYSMSIMHLCYSRGDELNELKLHLENALEYRRKQKYFADALPPEEQKNRIDWEELHLSDLERTLKWFAFAYCLNMGQAYYQEVLDLIGNQGRDALFDQIAVKLGDTEREVAESVLFKRRFNKLYKVIEAEPAQRPQLMLAYLEAWYKLEGSPDYHLMDTDAYDGYWCWEAALFTKLYEIDDSLYIDHQYYPKDLVHWSEQ